VRASHQIFTRWVSGKISSLSQASPRAGFLVEKTRMSQKNFSSENSESWDQQQDDHLHERMLSSQQIVKGKFLKAFRDQVVLPDESISYREYVKHPGAVVVAAQLPDGRWVMERQFRYPVQQVMLEFPAGKLDPNEDPLTCAQRELWEETGYVAQEWGYAGCMHPCIGYSDEIIHIYFARGLTLRARKLDEGEFLDVFAASTTELLNHVKQGQLTDAKSLSVLLWLQNLELGVWTLTWQSVCET
jgi:ADP-ribose pyrophosphatase